MAPSELLSRILDPEGETVFDRLGDWPRWLPSTLTWILVGLALAAVLLVGLTTATYS